MYLTPIKKEIWNVSMLPCRMSSNRLIYSYFICTVTIFNLGNSWINRIVKKTRIYESLLDATIL